MANHPNYFVREQKFWYPWDRLGHLKMTYIGNGPGPGLSYGKTAFDVLKKSGKWAEYPFFPKKIPEIC